MTDKSIIQAKLVFKKKTYVLPKTGFYFTSAEKKEEDKVFCLYAFDEADNQILAYIPKQVIFDTIAKYNLALENTSQEKQTEAKTDE